MHQHALTRVRRKRSQEPPLRLLAFQLRQQWFCLPLTITRRVLTQEIAADGKDVELIQFQNEPILVLNAANLVYGTNMPQLTGQDIPSPPAKLAAPAQEQNIVVLDLSRGHSLGLKVDSPPVLKRVRQSALAPVPSVYISVHQLRGVTHVVNPDDQATNGNSQPMFLIAIESLLPA